MLADLARLRVGETLIAVKSPVLLLDRPSRVIPLPDFGPIAAATDRAVVNSSVRAEATFRSGADWFSCLVARAASAAKGTVQQVDGAVAEYERRRGSA